MTYEYECCGVHEIVKSVSDIDRTEPCPHCGRPMRRIVSKSNFKIEYVHHKGEWNPGLGTYVKNESHKRELLNRYKREHGSELIEVGNDKIEKHIEPAEIQQEKKFSRFLDGI